MSPRGSARRGNGFVLTAKSKPFWTLLVASQVLVDCQIWLRFALFFGQVPSLSAGADDEVEPDSAEMARLRSRHHIETATGLRG